MASSTGEEAPLVSMEAKMIVATGHEHCQQLKDVVSKEDPASMVVVITSSKKTTTTRNPSCSSMDPGLLAVACSGSWKELKSFLKGDPRPKFRDRTIRCSCFFSKKRHSVLPPQEATGSSAVQQPSHDEEDPIRQAFLDGVTVEGDYFLHVMATNCKGEEFVQDELIRRKAVEYLSKKNEINNDTPLHCAARAGKYKMVTILVDLARGSGGANTLKELLEARNKSGWTALHEAVRVGNNEMVTLLINKDPELATVIAEDGTSPMYLAILLEHKDIAETLHKESKEVLSYSGPDRQNALHAAVLRGKDLTEMLLRWNNALTTQQDKDGSTPLHLAASVPAQRWPRERRAIQSLLVEANQDQLYQPDKDGLFPIHVAASVGAIDAIGDFLEKSPDCAGLRDAGGRTFLHVAVDQIKINIVRFASIRQSLSWILNMQDNDGNTALHLAVQKASLPMFSALFGNRKVNINLTNKKGETLLDIADRNLPKRRLYYSQSSEARINVALSVVEAKRGIGRLDYLGKNDAIQATEDGIHVMDVVKDATQTLSIGSVLIATVTFGATFAMPGGYKADDHTNGGTPTLSGRYDFDAFIMANALAFAFSVIATVALMSSGSPLYNLQTRVSNLVTAFRFMFFSVTCLVTAFALGTYMMLAPVAPTIAATVCALSFLVFVYTKRDGALNNAIVYPAIWRRQWRCARLVPRFALSLCAFLLAILSNLRPIGLIFVLTALRYRHG